MVHGRPWYQHVVVTTTQLADGYGCIRGIHLGSEANPPESLVQLQHRTNGDLQPVAGALLKAYASFTLLPFALLPDRGFAANPFVRRFGDAYYGLGGEFVDDSISEWDPK